MSEELIDFICREIDRLHISQRELSRRAGLSDMAVNYIVKNPTARPNVDTCVSLARALDVPERVLLELAGYTDIGRSMSLDKSVAAFAIYLHELPETVRQHCLDACWAITRIMAEALEE